MHNESPVALSQQTVSWLLQAMGILAEERATGRTLKKVSASTVKSALAGDPILNSWRCLVGELFAVFGVALSAHQAAGLEGHLRSWDQRVSQLDTSGLEIGDRAPAMLRLLAPEIGLRLGALAAIMQKRDPDASNWLCEPLSPKAFGRLVTWLFRRHRPDLSTAQLRYEKLHTVNVNSRTVERWDVGDVKVPNAAKLAGMASLMPEDAQRSALAVLRVGRLLMVLRRSVGEWCGPVAAQQFDEVVSSWARAARAALSQSAFQADLGDQYAIGLESSAGEQFLRNLLPALGATPDATTAAEFAARVRAASAEVRASGGEFILPWMLRAQLVSPHPLVVLAVGGALGIPPDVARVAVDPLQIIQATWQLQAAYLRIAAGEAVYSRPSTAPGAVGHHPGRGLIDLASRLAADGRRLWRRPEDPAVEDAERISFLVQLAVLGGGVGSIPEVVAMVNTGLRRSAVPAELESLATDEMLAAHTHLIAARARRLAHEGRAAEALDWLMRWMSSAGPKSPYERVSVAEASAATAHHLLDRLAASRVEFRHLRDRPVESLPRALREQVNAGQQAFRVKMQAHLSTTSRLFDLASQLLPNWAGTPDEVTAIVLLLPLALRIDWLASDSGELADEDLPRSRPLAHRLCASDRALPDHGPALATLAVWQRVVGDDNSLTLRRAEHFGSLPLFEAEIKRLAPDGHLDQDAGRD